MFYITGDTHGDFGRFLYFKQMANPTADDVMIILGDAGINYYAGKKDIRTKTALRGLGFTLFCIHGNHEMRPTDVASYQEKEFCGGTVWWEEEFPNILFAKDGEIYNFDGHRCMVIGGAYSVDKFYRLANGYSWFSNEQPSQEIKDYVEKQLAEHEIDLMLSHTCPKKYEPTEVFLRGVNQLMVDKSTEEWLDKIEESTDYKKWYCGHYHTEKKIDKLEFMFETIDMLQL